MLIVLDFFDVLNMAGIAGLWSVFIAFQYAKLWTDGYDWRDVFKQPRDRLFFDVVAESIDDFRALFDRKKRAEVLERDRERARRRSLAGQGGRRGGRGGGSGTLETRDLRTLSGAHATTVREAERNRDDILRLLETLPKSDREQLADVPSSAEALLHRIEGLALNLADLERKSTPGAAESMEQEIARLEAQANPLDHQASETRIRRLAQLKRERRAVADSEKRKQQIAGKPESCSLALQNMRYDVLRLKTGGQTFAQITLVAERAMSLAQEVDNAVYVADEMAKLKGRRV